MILALLKYCPANWQYYTTGDKCYGATGTAVDWATAVSNCLSITNNAGKLAEPADSGSGQFLKNTFGSGTKANYAYFYEPRHKLILILCFVSF